MRRRLIVTFLALATMGGGSLAVATPASATELNYVCMSGPDVPNRISCGVTIPSDKDLLSIQWFVDGVFRSNSGSSTDFAFACTAGQRYNVTFIVDLSPPPPPQSERITRSLLNILCHGPRISSVHAGCSSGGLRLQCSVSYSGGTPPVSIMWVVNGVLKTNFNDRRRLDISCTPGSVSVSVTVSDLNGGLTASGVCNCHDGPLD